MTDAFNTIGIYITPPLTTFTLYTIS